jgi:hypothetical protein
MSTTKYIVNNGQDQTIGDWGFGATGLTFPDDTVQATAYPGTPTFISSGNSAPGSAVVANPTNVDINFSDGIGTAWSFGTTGLTFPDETVQATAYAGPAETAMLRRTPSGSLSSPDNSLQVYGFDELTLGYQYLDTGLTYNTGTKQFFNTSGARKVYNVSVSLAYASNANGLRSVEIWVNGSISGGSACVRPVGSAGDITIVNVSGNIVLGDSEYFEIRGYQNSGTNLSIINAATSISITTLAV